MALPPFTRLRSLPDTTEGLRDEMHRSFDDVESFLDRLVAIPWLDGVLLEGEELAASGTTQVPHKLGRAYQGWWVVSGSVNGDYPGEGTSDDETKFLALTVTGAQTVDLWVF